MTEGDSELASLPELYAQLQQRIGRQMLKPIRASVDPIAPIPKIVRDVKERIRLAFANGADSVVVLLDREKLQDSASLRAAQIQSALRRELAGKTVHVVIKDRMYENWLLSCPVAFDRQPGRFPNRDRLKNLIPGRADAAHQPSRLIGEAIGNGQYEKVSDSVRILRHADIEIMARNSRSFRRFLAVLGDNTYATSSCRYIALRV